MKFLSHLDDDASRTVNYESTITITSCVLAGAAFTIQRISLGRRMQLARRVLELSRQMEFREAGAGVEDKIQANILSFEIDRLYLQWGLVTLGGLTIDGVDATAESLAEKGPEDLVREIVDAVKQQCGLSEGERKN
ncbi:MAG: hypothetical protein ABSH09_18410 [Bryobacteraceae bacterium]